MLGAFVLAHVAIESLNIDIVDGGKMSRFNNFRIGNFLDYGQVDRGR